MMNEYGVYETNPITKDFHNEDFECISWQELQGLKNVKSERIRFVTDPGFPFWDCSYFYIRVNNKRFRVLNHPFQQIKKGNLKGQLYNILKHEGIFINGFFNSISTLN